ncbi:unnamed protein product [Closterium sp. NIES-53]
MRTPMCFGSTQTTPRPLGVSLSPILRLSHSRGMSTLLPPRLQRAPHQLLRHFKGASSSPPPPLPISSLPSPLHSNLCYNLLHASFMPWTSKCFKRLVTLSPLPPRLLPPVPSTAVSATTCCTPFSEASHLKLPSPPLSELLPSPSSLISCPCLFPVFCPHLLPFLLILAFPHLVLSPLLLPVPFFVLSHYHKTRRENGFAMLG